jgi:TDG/mug DNA glycosylase family protein
MCRREPSRSIASTNVVKRATATAAELSRAELQRGGSQLVAFVRRWRPAYLAVLGVTAYRASFEEPKATLGEQPRTIGATRLWVLPNPPGLNAYYQPPARPAMSAELHAVVSASAAGR